MDWFKSSMMWLRTQAHVCHSAVIFSVISLLMAAIVSGSKCTSDQRKEGGVTFLWVCFSGRKLFLQNPSRLLLRSHAIVPEKGGKRTISHLKPPQQESGSASNNKDLQNPFHSQSSVVLWFLDGLHQWAQRRGFSPGAWVWGLEWLRKYTERWPPLVEGAWSGSWQSILHRIIMNCLWR